MFVYLIRDVDNFYKVGGAMLDISTNKNNSEYVYSTRDMELLRPVQSYHYFNKRGRVS